MSLNETVKTIIADHFGRSVDDIKDDTQVIDEDVGTDSLEYMEFLMALEEEFGVHIPDDDMGRLTTLAETVKYLRGMGIGHEEEKDEKVLSRAVAREYSVCGW